MITNSEYRNIMQSTNFEFMRATHPELASLGGFAEHYAVSDPASGAHQGIRRMLVDENQLEAVVSLPSGVFKPYAGVSTAILVFTKGGRTDNVWFYKVEADGYSLDDKRTPGKDNDLPDLVAQWKARSPKKHTNRAKKAFFIPVAEIRENRHDLSINRYKEIEYEEVQYDPPAEILNRLESLEGEIMKDLKELRLMVDV